MTMDDGAYKRLWVIWWSLLISSIIFVTIGAFSPNPWPFFVVGSVILGIWMCFGFFYDNRMIREYISRRGSDP